MPTAFEQLSKIQSDLSDLSLTAHVAGYHDLSATLSDFRLKIETVNNDMQVFFHENEPVLRKLSD